MLIFRVLLLLFVSFAFLDFFICFPVIAFIVFDILLLCLLMSVLVDFVIGILPSCVVICFLFS